MGTQQKSKAIIMTADGKGGMVAVQDLRFEGGDWPIQLKLEGEPKKLWATLLLAEIFKRQWPPSSFDQLDPAECSGSQTVRTEVGAIEIVWSETKEGPLQIQARMAGEMSPDTVREFLSAVAEQCRNPIFTSSDWRAVLYHNGHPWRGELWLDERTRLGPPSQQFNENMYGEPHVVVVDYVRRGRKPFGRASAGPIEAPRSQCLPKKRWRNDTHLAWRWHSYPFRLRPGGLIDGQAPTDG